MTPKTAFQLTYKKPMVWLVLLGAYTLALIVSLSMILPMYDTIGSIYEPDSVWSNPDDIGPEDAFDMFKPTFIMMFAYMALMLGYALFYFLVFPPLLNYNYKLATAKPLENWYKSGLKRLWYRPFCNSFLGGIAIYIVMIVVTVIVFITSIFAFAIPVVSILAFIIMYLIMLVIMLAFQFWLIVANIATTVEEKYFDGVKGSLKHFFGMLKALKIPVIISVVGMVVMMGAMISYMLVELLAGDIDESRIFFIMKDLTISIMIASFVVSVISTFIMSWMQILGMNKYADLIKE